MMTRIRACSSIAFAAAVCSSIIAAQNPPRTSKNPRVAAIEQQIAGREMWILRREVQQKLRKITGKADLPMTCYTCHKGKAKPDSAPE
jgi:hypothetical protein